MYNKGRSPLTSLGPVPGAATRTVGPWDQAVDMPASDSSSIIEQLAFDQLLGPFQDKIP